MNTQTLNRKKSNKEIKVLAINTLYEYAELFFNYEYEFFSKLAGIDPFKVDGTLKQKYEHEKVHVKKQLQDGTWLDAHYWLTSRNNSLDISIKICVNGGSYDDKPSTAFCQYEEQTLTLLKADNGKLLATDKNIEWLKERYDLQKLSAIAAKIKEAEKVYDAAINTMPYIFKEVFDIRRLAY